MTANQSTQPPRTGAASAIIMAAGKGTRMQSDLAKVLHPVVGRPMVHWVVDACIDAGATPVVLIVGHGADLVKKSFDGGAYRPHAGDAARGGAGSSSSGAHATSNPVEFVTQDPQLGTGHAVDQARAHFAAGRLGRETLVLGGDGPLIRTDTLHALLHAHRTRGAAATLATSIIPDPRGYGRVIRTNDGGLDRIVEDRDATPEQKQIREINPSYYCFDTALLFDALARVTNTNAAREYYLTDVFTLLRKDGKLVAVVDAVPPEDVLSINTPEQLREVDGLLRARLARSGLSGGAGAAGGAPAAAALANPPTRTEVRS